MEHKLIGGTLTVERDKKGKVLGVMGRCTCGWNTGHKISMMTASIAFQDHQEEAALKEQGLK